MFAHRSAAEVTMTSAASRSRASTSAGIVSHRPDARHPAAQGATIAASIAPLLAGSWCGGQGAPGDASSSPLSMMVGEAAAHGQACPAAMASATCAGPSRSGGQQRVPWKRSPRAGCGGRRRIAGQGQVIALRAHPPE
jgi:hypothetical protein